MQPPLPPEMPIADAPIKRARVLHCIPTLTVGGAETQLRLLAPRLQAQNIDVAIFGRFGANDAGELARQGITCFPMGNLGNYDPRVAATLIRAVRAWRPSVIQTWLTQMDILGGLVARISGTPWIIAERTAPPAYAPSAKNRFRQWLGKSAIIVANAPHGLAVWPDHLDGQVIGNGVDLAGIRAIPADRMRTAKAFGNRFCVISVCRLVPEKSVDILIEATDLARRAVPNIRLIIVGDGPARSALETLVATRGLKEHVVFAGFQSAPVEWVRSADMFASASRFEGHPNAVTEAAAANVPTILSDIVMHRTLMGDAARYAAVGDATGFAAQFVDLARDPGARDAIATAASRAVERFDIDAMAAGYATLYQRVSL